MELIRDFSEIGKNDVAIAGGKGASLGEMTQAGISVPNGFVVLSEAFDQFIKETDLNVEIDAVLDTVKPNEIHTVEHASEKIQAMILDSDIPKNIGKEINKFFDKLGCKFVAVRSSATSEDSASAAWAGQLDTFLNTTKENLLENVKKCWASLFTPRAIFYRFEKDLQKENISVAVVVQKMVNSEESGIAFSVHPVTEDKNQIIIEAGFGLGEAIVSGSVTPDSYVVDKQDWHIIDINVNEQTRGLFRKEKGGNEWKELGEEGKGQVLDEREIIELSKLILKIEKHYGFPVDVEWAKESGEFYITQSRPITTLSENVSGDVKKNIELVGSSRGKINSQIYEPLWRIPGLHYLICSMFLESYGSGRDFVALNDRGVHTLFISKDERAKLSKEGFEIYNEGYGGYEKKIREQMNISQDFFRKIKKKDLKKLSNMELADDFLKFIEYLILIWDDYFWTEYFCSDEVTEILEKEDSRYDLELLGNNVQKMAKLKLEQRIYLNLIFYPPSLLDKYSEEIGNRLKLSNVTDYHYRELADLLKGQNIKIGDRSFVVCGEFSGWKAVVGSEARKIAEQLIDYDINVTVLKGNIGNKGNYKGRIKIIEFGMETNYTEEIKKMEKGQVLVSGSTGPEMILACKKAGAIVTEEGGITSHASIVSRELGIPCVIGTKIATQVLKDGDKVEVDADNGIVRILEKKNGSKKTMVSKFYSREHSLFYYKIESDDNIHGHKDFPEWPSIPNVVVVKEPKTLKTSIWHNQKEVNNASDSFEKSLLADKDLFYRVVAEFTSSFSKLKPFLDKSKKIDSIKDLKDYYNSLVGFWSPMSYAMFVPDMDVPPKEMLSKALELREETQDYADVFDDLYLDYFESHFPQHKDLSRYLLPEEIFVLGDRGFTKEEIGMYKKRMNEGYVMVNGELGLYPELNALLERNNLELEVFDVGDVNQIRGSVACKGNVKGIVKLVLDKNQFDKINDGDVLVTEMTSPDFIPVLKKCSAIITDEGGIACHAAIVSREMKKPCIIGTKIATQILKDGDEVEVDADNGIVRKI